MTLVTKLIKQVTCNRCGRSFTLDPDAEICDNTCSCETGPKEWSMDPEEWRKVPPLRLVGGAGI